MTSGWGPEEHLAAVSVTFDHLGEAAEMQIGRIPLDAPVGDHHSVTQELPRLLDMLAAHRQRTTFFIEAWNLDVYPEAVRSIIAAGHEVGWHGWLHEPWYQSSSAEIAESVHKSLDAFDRFGIRPRGARPPAGLQGDHSLELLNEAGFDYVSLAGTSFGSAHGLALLPYPWHAVDGAYYVPGFTRLRVPPGDDPVGPDEMLDAYQDLVDEVVDRRGCLAFVFHVPWQDSPEKVAAISTLLDRLSADERVWLASGDAIADAVHENQERFPIGHRDEVPAW